MRYYKKVVGLLIMVIALFSKINNAKAAVSFDMELKDYKELSTYEEYTYNIYANITGSSKFNYADGEFFDLSNVEDISVKGVNGFNARLDLDKMKYQVITNKVFTANDGKVVFATLTFRSISKDEKCKLSHRSGSYRFATTNTFTVENSMYQDGKEISVTKASIRAGEAFQFKIKVKSAMNELLTDWAIVTDNVPDFLEIISASDNGIINGQKVTWNLGMFNSNVEKEKELMVYVRAKKDAKGSATNTVTLTAGDNKFTDSDPVEIVYSNIVASNKASKSEIIKGETFYYTIELKNTGTVISNDIRIEDTLDSDLELVNSSVTNSGLGNYLIFDIGKIDVGKSKSIRLEVKVRDEATKSKIKNMAVIKESGQDAIESSAIINIAEKQVLPDLSISKKANVSEVKKGEEIIYTITIKNNNDLDLNNILIIDSITNAEFIRENVECSGGKSCRFYLDLAGNETKTITIVAKVLDDTNGNTVKNTVTLNHGNFTKTSEVLVNILSSDKPDVPNNPDNPTDEPSKPSNSNNSNDLGELPDNPDTGIIISIAIIIFGIVSSLGIYLYHKKKNKFYKI